MATNALEELAKVLRTTCGNDEAKVLTGLELAKACEIAAERASYREWEDQMGDDL